MHKIEILFWSFMNVQTGDGSIMSIHISLPIELLAAYHALKVLYVEVDRSHVTPYHHDPVLAGKYPSTDRTFVKIWTTRKYAIL